MDFEPKSRAATPSAPKRAEPAPARSAAHGTPAYQKTDKKAAPEIEIAPGIIDLKAMDKFDLPEETAAAFDKKGKGYIHAKFGKLAEGTIEVTGHAAKPKPEQGHGTGYPATHRINRQSMPLAHPLFRSLTDAAPGLEPQLVVSAEAGKPIEGHVGFAKGGDLATYLQKAPEMIGLAGFELPAQFKTTNEIKSGMLNLGLSAKVHIGSAFDGQLDIEVADELINRFDATAHLAIHRVAKGDLLIHRGADGKVTGRAMLDLDLPPEVAKHFTGSATVLWDERGISGEAKLGYQGEKLSGTIIMQIMEKQAALQLAKDKKSPPDPAAAAPEAAAAPAKAKAKPQHVDYVLFGEGDLNFAFSEWLTGTAHGIVDPEGYVTLTTKITPQKEIKLFKDNYRRQIGPTLEIGATWGLPVIADVFIGANGSLFAIAGIEGVLQNIEADGDYSTDPERMNSFTLQGTLNISAMAGLELRLEVLARLTILKHSIEAGGGLNGDIGVHGYVLATPTIGYREVAKPGEDKKGEFFIKGDMEMAAQAFLGLSGDVFIRLRTPWWSPLSDRDWPWQLFSMEWPIGGSIGIGAEAEYVFGSGKAPSINFKDVDFDSSKLISDLIHDDVGKGGGEKGKVPGKWKEKNAGARQPPPKAPEPEKKPPDKAVHTKSTTPASKNASHPKDDDPKHHTKSGKTVEQLQQEARQRGKQPPGEPHPAAAAEHVPAAAPAPHGAKPTPTSTPASPAVHAASASSAPAPAPKAHTTPPAPPAHAPEPPHPTASHPDAAAHPATPHPAAHPTAHPAAPAKAAAHPEHKEKAPAAAKSEHDPKKPKDLKKAKTASETSEEDKKKKAAENHQRGINAIHQALARFQKDGIHIDDLNLLLKKIAGHKEYGFSHLIAQDAQTSWHVADDAHPGQTLGSVPKGFTEPIWAHERRKTEVEGKKHTLLFHLRGHEEQLYLESEGIEIGKFLEELELQPGADKSVVKKVRGLVTKIRNLMKDSAGKTRSMGTERGKEIAALMDKIADELPNIVPKNKPFRPPSNIKDHQTHSVRGTEYGLRVLAEPLSIRPPLQSGWTGSTPHDTSALWEQIRPGAGKRPDMYVLGHLLNHNLFGPGINKNMTPIHKKLNSQMSAKVETPVKQAVLEGNKVVSYDVTVNYSPAWDEATYRKATEFKKQNINHYIPDEQYLARSIRLKAHEMEPAKGKQGDKVGDWELSKKSGALKIEMKLDNYRFPDFPDSSD